MQRQELYSRKQTICVQAEINCQNRSAGKLKLESVQQAFQTRYKGKVAQANADVAADAYSFVLEAKNRL